MHGDLIPILASFSNQREGSEYFYDKLEGIFTDHSGTLTFAQIATIAYSYYKVRCGTAKFFENALFKPIQNKALWSKGTAKDIALLA